MSYLDRDPHGMYSSGDSNGPGPRLMGAGPLMGEDVINSEGEDLGNIKEFILDMETGQVAYAVLSFGGVLGIADKLFAVPLQALTLDTDRKCFVLDVPKERLRNAPGFDKDRWPDMANQQFNDDIHGFYNMPSSVPSAMMSSGNRMGEGAASMQNASGSNASIQSGSSSAAASGMSRQGGVSGAGRAGGSASDPEDLGS